MITIEQYYKRTGELEKELVLARQAYRRALLEDRTDDLPALEETVRAAFKKRNLFDSKGIHQSIDEE